MQTAVPPRNSVPHQHLILAFAACCQGAPTLPAGSFLHFNRLLQGMRLAHSDRGDAHSLTPSHERAWARACGLPVVDGLVPLAAWQHQQQGGQPGTQGWAHITPCHWAMNHGQATMTDPSLLRLDAAHAQQLRCAMQPYFATHGITLHELPGQTPACWLAQGEIFSQLPTAALDCVIGQDVYPWLPTGKAGQTMRLLQNEMQMLLYTHPVNDERLAQGLAPVNSFWISASGALPAVAVKASPLGKGGAGGIESVGVLKTVFGRDGFRGCKWVMRCLQLFQSPPTPPFPRREEIPNGCVQLCRTLAQAALQGTASDYAQAWATLDADIGAALCAAQQQGQAVQLTLCGEHHALTFATVPATIFSKIKSVFGSRPLPGLLETL